MRRIPEGTPRDSHGPLPMSERVMEVARYTKDNDHAKRQYLHYYQCPEDGIADVPCRHWAGERGFGTPHKARVEQFRIRRKKKKHHNERSLCP